MSWFEIILLIVGIGAFVGSYFLVGGSKQAPVTDKKQEQRIKELTEQAIKDAKDKLEDSVDETVTYSMEKSERALERITNEKIMAVNEYSDTVLEEIRKNHEEVVFLYSMLNDKHTNLKDTAIRVEQKAKEVEEVAKEAGVVAKEAGEVAKVAHETVKKAEIEVKSAEIHPKMQEIIQNGTPTIVADAIVDKTIKKKDKKKEEKDSKAEKERKSELQDMPQLPANEGGRNNNEKILKMHRQGRSNMAIAKELGLGIGEVKLVIDLYRQAK